MTIHDFCKKILFNNTNYKKSLDNDVLYVIIRIVLELDYIFTQNDLIVFLEIL